MRGQDAQARFNQRLLVTDSCWEWTGARDGAGYGMMKFGRPSRTIRAHRASWLLHRGPIPAGMIVCHHCDNPPCVRPEHLFLGTPSDNNWDMAKKGRHGRPQGTGERNSNAKLTNAAVQAIRVAAGTQRTIAATFGVSQSAVSRIRAGKNWGDTLEAVQNGATL